MRYVVQGISKRARIISEVGDWLKEYVWQYYGTFTFKKDISPVAAERRFVRFMASLENGVQYFYVLECHSMRRCDHIHCVLGPLGNISGEDIQKKWQRKYGIAKIEPYDETKGGLYYLCKRIADARTEWGFELN